MSFNSSLPAGSGNTKIRFFEVRDLLSAEMANGTMKLTMTQMAVFRYLLENAFYTDDNRRGWVRHDCCGIDTIAAQIMSSPVTIRRALAALTSLGLISRRVRPLAIGGRAPDEIRIEWHGIDGQQPRIDHRERFLYSKKEG